MKILIENSTWNNIGDSFYQSTLYALFKELYPSHDVLMGEGPIERAFRPKFKKQKSNFFQLMDYQEADIHVFSGPIIPTILTRYKDKIIDIKKKGRNYMLISVSGVGLNSVEIKEIGGFLQKYPPLLFSSRDEDTYIFFKEFVSNSYNGICTSFLVNRLLPVDKIKLDTPFFISSFYNELEPVYEVEGLMKLENVKVKRKSTIFNLNHDFSRHLNFLRPQQESLKNYKIIRVHQDLSTHYYHIKFSHPNSFMSFNPLSYLALYKSTEFTISDRVHSCAVTLAFGNPAKLYSKSPRAGIFDRLGINYKENNGIMYPNLYIIDEEFERLKEVIRKSI